MFDTKTLNVLCKDFNDVKIRKQIIEQYKNVDTAFTGENEHGEMVELHIGSEELITKTYQDNGWVRVNYYDSEGEPTGETFEGRWA